MTTQEAALALGVPRTNLPMVLGWAEQIPGRRGGVPTPTLYLREDVETEANRRAAASERPKGNGFEDPDLQHERRSRGGQAAWAHRSP